MSFDQDERAVGCAADQRVRVRGQVRVQFPQPLRLQRADPVQHLRHGLVAHRGGGGHHCDDAGQGLLPLLTASGRVTSPGGVSSCAAPVVASSR
jgi:hypothetical protein